MSIFDNIIKVADNKYASKVSEGNVADVDTYVDTGSMTLNALMSGSIFGGLPVNKVTAFAGEPATGKTFFALNVVKQFLLDNPEGFVLYFESESAVTTEMLNERQIDTKRIAILPVVTIQEFRSQAVRMIDAYIEENEANPKNRKPMLMILDSLGMLSTTKEVTDIAEGKESRDMTRAQLIRGAFRVLSLKLGRAKVALLLTNHTYEEVGAYMPSKIMSGGQGTSYAASNIVFLSKSKYKDVEGGEVTGARITCKNNKSRLTIENRQVETLLDYHSGLHRYYGLLPIAEKHGVIKKIGNKYELPGGVSAFEKSIYKNPEKYFTKDLLDQIDKACNKEFCYGKEDEVAQETVSE